MTDRGEAAFVAFVSARSPALLRTAYLLTGDRGHAEASTCGPRTRRRRRPRSFGAVQRQRRRPRRNLAGAGTAAAPDARRPGPALLGSPVREGVRRGPRLLGRHREEPSLARTDPAPDGRTARRGRDPGRQGHDPDRAVAPRDLSRPSRGRRPWPRPGIPGAGGAPGPAPATAVPGRRCRRPDRAGRRCCRPPAVRPRFGSVATSQRGTRLPLSPTRILGRRSRVHGRSVAGALGSGS